MDLPNPRPRPSDYGPSDSEWKRLFVGRSPLQILRTVLDGDQLGLRTRCEARIRSQALLLDAHRLQLRTVALIARHGGHYCGEPVLDAWVDEQVRRALTQLLEEDDQGGNVTTLAQLEDERLLAVADELGLEPSSLQRGFARFNATEHAVRMAFYALVLEAQSVDEWCNRNSMNREQALSAVRSALWALGVRDMPSLDDLITGAQDG